MLNYLAKNTSNYICFFVQEIVKKSSSSSIAFSSESDGTGDDTEDGLEQVKKWLEKSS